ncbi:hypothetical protein LXL04_031558 [Taraxacum kok-saghyz]
MELYGRSTGRNGSQPDNNQHPEWVQPGTETGLEELGHVDMAGGAARSAGGGAYPERPGEPPCQYYLRTGTCKFGASCKFNHPRHAGGSLSNVPLNTYGYPLRGLVLKDETRGFMHTSICTSLLGNKLTEVTETHHLQQPTVFSDQNTPPINVRLYGSAWEIIFVKVSGKPSLGLHNVPSEHGERRMDGDNQTMKVYKTAHHGDVDDDHVADKYGGYYVEK